MRSPVRSRVAVAYSFAVLGVILAGWASRASEIKAHVGADDREWGLLLLSGPLGALAAFLLMRVLIAPVGARRLMLAIVPGVALAPTLVALARTPTEFVLAFFLNGMMGAGLQTPLNANAVFVERAYGRPIMASFHAWFSIGLLSGALIAAAATQLDVGVAPQLAVTGVVLVVGFLVTIPFLPPDEAVPAREGRKRRAITRQLALLGSIAFCSSMGEGAATAWSNVYVRESLHAGKTLGTIAYAFYAVCASASRLSADRFLHRLGRRRFLRAAGLVAAAGTATGMALGTIPGAFVAFAFLGIGLAAVIPTVFGAAGNQPDTTAGEGLATVTLLYWPAFLLGPAVIGTLAHATSLRTAFFVPVVTACVFAFLARWVRNTDDPVEGPTPVES
jgi:MFS family permease